MSRAPFLRLRPSSTRRAQLVWDLLRAGESLTVAACVESASVSDSHAKHLLARLAAERLIRLAGEIDNGTPNPAYVYQLARDLGPLAPILRGGLQAGAKGYSDPNKPRPAPARQREAKRLPEGNAPYEEARRLRLLRGMSQAEMGQALGVSSDTIRRWETPPAARRHERIPARRLEEMRVLRAPK